MPGMPKFMAAKSELPVTAFQPMRPPDTWSSVATKRESK
jgi:hypothetical protein